MRFLRLVHSPKLEDAGTHNTFQSLPREVRDLNYDYLLDQPVLQLVSGAKGHEHTHVPCRKAPKTNIRADGEDPALCAQTSDLEPTHAKYQVSTSTSAYLVCRQIMTELRARESWRAHHGTSHRDNLLVHCTEKLVGIPAGLLAANPTNLAVLVCLAFPKEIPSDHVASILHELRTYAIKLGIHLERLKDLRIGLQLHNCMLGSSGPGVRDMEFGDHAHAVALADGHLAQPEMLSGCERQEIEGLV